MAQHLWFEKEIEMEVMLVKLGQHSDQLFDLKIGLNLYYFFVSILVEKKQIQNEIVEISFVEIFEFPPETEILLSLNNWCNLKERNFPEYYWISSTNTILLTNAISCLEAWALSLLLEGGGGRW